MKHMMQKAFELQTQAVKTVTNVGKKYIRFRTSLLSYLL